MPASILFQNTQYQPDEFVRLDLGSSAFQGLVAGQQFLQLWLNNKQIFDQKTSGSTGKPSVHQISRAQFQSSAQRTVTALGLKAHSRALVCINMAYIGGKLMLVRGMLNDWELHLVQPDVDLSHEVAGLHYDFAAMVPIQLQKLVATAPGRSLLNNIKCLIIGGAAMSSELTESIQDLECAVYATYGMTETVSHVALQKLNGADRSDAFTMLPGVEFDTDARGCLKIKADVTNDQWIQTNDLVALQGQNQFKILGRADNIINTGGVKVQIETLETLIAQTGMLAGQAFAISSLADETLGQKIVLAVEGTTADGTQLLVSLKKVLPPYHAPKALFSIEQLPKTPSGKLDRPTLKAQLSKIAS